MMNRLNYFISVVETGSVSQASQRFDVQPSSVSRQLAALEKELGVRLLNRTTRNIGLTEAGKVYYQYAQRIVAEFDEAGRAVHELQTSPKGTLRVNSTVGYGESCVLPIVPEFLKRYPEINLEIELTERVVDMVEDSVDVAIRSGTLADSTLIAQKLVDNDFLLCASPGYLKRQGTPESPDQLVYFDCIHYGYPGWKNWFLIDSITRKIALGNGPCVNTVNGQKLLLANDVGLALIPRWAVSKELRDGKFVQVLEQYQFSPQEKMGSIYSIYLSRKLVPRKILVFLEFIKNYRI